MKPANNTHKHLYKDTYQRVTDSVIETLEKGEVIWQKPWNTLGLPKNILTGHNYRAWNVFFLNFITLNYHYTTPYFITLNQATQKGGRIKKGAKGTPVIYWASVERKSKVTTVNQEEKEEKGLESHTTYLVPKVHIVFNIDQTEGIASPKVEQLFRNHTEKIEACEKVVNQMPQKPLLVHGGDSAFYNRITDTITLPKPELFHSDASYYATLFHELAHSTGHTIRLNRKELLNHDGFGKENYSKEELTAELCAAYLCAICSIESSTIQNSVAYMQGWLKALQNDKTLILKAAAQAQAAADYILSDPIASQNIKGEREIRKLT